MERSSFRPLVSISAVQSSESTNIHLVAVTSSGVRLYFTALYGRYFNEANPSARPSTLQLVHVRLPPGTPFNRTNHKTFHLTLYHKLLNVTYIKKIIKVKPCNLA